MTKTSNRSCKVRITTTSLVVLLLGLAITGSCACRPPTTDDAQTPRSGIVDRATAQRLLDTIAIGATREQVAAIIGEPVAEYRMEVVAAAGPRAQAPQFD